MMIFFNFRLFENLNYIFGPQFRNFTEMDPYRPATGRQGPVARPPGDRTPVAQWPGDRVFLQNFDGQKHRNAAGRSSEGPVARPPGDRPPAPYKMCLPPPGRSFGARNFQKKERGVGKVKRRSPAGFLACDL